MAGIVRSIADVKISVRLRYARDNKFQVAKSTREMVVPLSETRILVTRELDGSLARETRASAAYRFAGVAAGGRPASRRLQMRMLLADGCATARIDITDLSHTRHASMKKVYNLIHFFIYIYI